MVCAVVLAAGRSSRMGVQKLLLPVGGQALIARVVDEVLRSPVEHVVVVVGQDGPRVAEALASRPLRFVTNPDAEGEMLSSVRCGLRALPEACDAVLVALGDQPADEPPRSDAPQQSCSPPTAFSVRQAALL